MSLAPGPLPFPRKQDCPLLYSALVVLLGLLLLSLHGACGIPQPPSAPNNPVEVPGLVVEGVDEGSSGHRGDLEIGDRLLSWRRAATPPTNPNPAEGSFESGLDLLLVLGEQLPRGPVTILGRRGQKAHQWVLQPGVPGLTVRPGHPPEVVATFQPALPEQSSARAAALNHLAIEKAEASPRLAIWLLYEAAREHLGQRRWQEALAAFQEAAKIARRVGAKGDEAKILYEQAILLDRRLGEPASALEVLERSENLWKELEMSLLLAETHTLKGEMGRRHGDLANAERELGQALRIKRQEAPGSLSTASSLSILGKVLAVQGQLDRAEKLLEEAAEIRLRLDPKGITAAHSLSALATLRLVRGDLAAGSEELQRALDRFEAQDPESSAVATLLANLGLVSVQRGDLVGAEGFYRRALALNEAFATDSLESSENLHSLAVLSGHRGDLESARDFAEQALEIRRRLAPDSLDLAATLTALANIAALEGETPLARARLEEALEIKRRQAPENFLVTASELGLARLDLEDGNFAAARQRLLRVEALVRRVAPRRFELGQALSLRGDAERAAGHWQAAEDLYRQAANHLSETAPGTTFEVDALWGLAQTLSRREDKEAAREIYRAAEAALADQRGRIGGSQEVRARFQARYDGLYRQHGELELEAGEVESALEVLERSRAQVLLSLLQSRDLVFRDLPADLDAERRRAQTGMDRAQEALLTSTGSATAEEIQRHLSVIRRARRQQQIVIDRIGEEVPRLSTLMAAPPLPLNRLTSTLDPGTVGLVYALGQAEGSLFVLQPGALPRVTTIEAGAEELRQQVESFRLRLQIGGQEPDPRQALSELAQQLYHLLIEPAAEEVGEAERLLIVPDGSLHLLPFAALERSEDPSKGRFLGVDKPLHTSTSLSVWAEILGRRNRPGGGANIVAFGDPEVSEGHLGNASMVKGGTALPASRAEAWAAAGSSTTSEVFLGKEATERAARLALARARIAHFAVHGFLDERFPLSSGLILASDSDGQEAGNGLLQAWEIFEGVRTQADLVILSGCETALGTEVPGEGLLGLTRAFQWAGARSVVASLWRVSDRATAAFMDRFYHHLRTGEPVAEALRQARQEMVSGPVAPPPTPGGVFRRVGRSLGLVSPPPAEDFSHPSHWAAFRLDGDWQ